MTITVDEKYEARSSKIGLYLKRDHTRKFVAVTDSGESSYEVATASGIPALGDSFPGDTVCLCVNVDAKVVGGEPNVWTITCKYTNDLPEEDIDDDDPVSRRAVSEWGADDFTRYATTDRDDVPILNTAGDRYEEPIELVDSFPTLSIRVNKASFNPATAYSYNNSTNSDTYRGADPGTLRVKITASEQWFGDSPYWALSIVFRYNPNGWQPKILEAGVYQKILDSRVPCYIKGENPHDSEPVTHPVPLDADGAQIDPTTLMDVPSPVIYTQWDVLPELPYSALGV